MTHGGKPGMINQYQIGTEELVGFLWNPHNQSVLGDHKVSAQRMK